jgi:thiol-disulfide isomerase/thioredoxin
MVRSSVFCLLCVVAGVGIGLVFTSSRALAIPDTPIGSPMLEFNLKDLDGKTHKLSDLKGKVVVICSWSTLCTYSRAIDPYVEELIDKYKEKDVVFYGVDAAEKFSGDADRAYQKNKGYRLTILEDPRNYFLRDLKCRRVPEFFVVDRKGILAFRGLFDDRVSVVEPGPNPYVLLAINDLLAGRPVAMNSPGMRGCQAKNLIEEE